MGDKRQPLCDLLSINFNQDYGCFSIGAVDGFRIYTSEPLDENVRLKGSLVPFQATHRLPPNHSIAANLQMEASP